MIRLVASTNGPMTVVIDASYVCKGFWRGPRWRHETNQDLWRALWFEVGRREGKVDVKKVASHVDPHLGDVNALDYLANEAADAAAGRAAVQAALPHHLVEQVRRVDEQAWLVQKRLLSIATLVFKRKDGGWTERWRTCREAPQTPACAPEPCHAALNPPGSLQRQHGQLQALWAKVLARPSENLAG